MSDMWDGQAFRSRMIMAAERSEAYRREHLERLRRGQSNGSQTTADEYFGKWFLECRLAGAAATETAATLKRELAELASHQITFPSVENQAAARRGFDIRLRELIAETERHL